MADIPLFSGSVGSSIAPQTSPVESLDIAAAERGARMAEQIPSTATAIARGVEGAVDTYQRQDANAVKIESAKLALERQKAMTPGEIEAQQLALQKERDAVAEEARIRIQRDELFEIFKSGSGREKAEATLGKYAEVFSKDPKLWEQAVKIAAPDYTPAEREGLIKSEYDKTWRNMMARDQLAHQNDFTKKQDSFFRSAEMDTVLSDVAGGKYRGRPDVFADKLEGAQWVPQGTYETDDRNGQVKRHSDGPNIGQIVKKNVSLTDAGKTYQIFDPKTGTLIAENVPQPFKDKYNGWSAARAQGQRARILPDSIPRVLEQAREINDRRAGRTPTEAAQPAPQVPQARNKPLPLSEVQKQLEKTPMVDASGKVVAAEGVTALMAQSLGASPEDAVKLGQANALHADLSEQLRKDIEAEIHPKPGVGRLWGIFEGRTEEQIAEEVATKEKQESFAKSSLALDWVNQKEELSVKYNDAAVKAHNDAYEKWRKYQDGSLNATGQTFTSGDFARLGGIYREISSPEELFIEERLPKHVARLAVTWDQAKRVGVSQAAASRNPRRTSESLLGLSKNYK